MAIAGSKLGRLIAAHLHDADASFVRVLRDARLVRPSAGDAAVLEARRRALAEPQSTFDSPHERVRVHLGPHLSVKGRAWAVPLDSLRLPDTRWGHWRLLVRRRFWR